MTPGLHTISNNAYHSSAGVSRSGLWTLYTKDPDRFRHPIIKKPSGAFDVGQAGHDAILQPDVFEATVIRGPEDRRGKKWSDLVEAYPEHIVLTEDDYDAVLKMRDAVHANRTFRQLFKNPVIERAAYANDAEHGVLVKCKPDFYSPGDGFLADIKTTLDASKEGFAKSVANFGYHMQEPVYGEVWKAAGGGDVNGFVFVCVEKPVKGEVISTYRPRVAVFELDPADYREGHAIYRKALATYAECLRADHWPGYDEGVQQLSMKRYNFRETRPEDEE